MQMSLIELKSIDLAFVLLMMIIIIKIESFFIKENNKISVYIYWFFNQYILYIISLIYVCNIYDQQREKYVYNKWMKRKKIR